MLVLETGNGDPVMIQLNKEQEFGIPGHTRKVSMQGFKMSCINVEVKRTRKVSVQNLHANSSEDELDLKVGKPCWLNQHSSKPVDFTFSVCSRSKFFGIPLEHIPP